MYFVVIDSASIASLYKIPDFDNRKWKLFHLLETFH